MELHSPFNWALDKDHIERIFIMKEPQTSCKVTDLQVSRSIVINSSEMQSAVAWNAAIVYQDMHTTLQFVASGEKLYLS